MPVEMHRVLLMFNVDYGLNVDVRFGAVSPQRERSAMITMRLVDFV